MTIGEEDRRILRRLQSDGRISNADLAEATGMSASPCWRRVRRLEQSGVIRGYGAELDRRKLGLGVLVYVAIALDPHSDDIVGAFERRVAALPEVIACHSVAGGTDYLLTAVSRDLDSYAVFSATVLRRLPGLKAMTTNFALKEVKPFAGLPLDL